MSYENLSLPKLVWLKASGDAAAAAEIARRKSPAPVADADVTKLDSAELRRLVVAWLAKPGDTPEDLARRRDLALRAYAELEVRYVVDMRLGTRPTPEPPSAPPWRAPAEARCLSWRRPRGSTLYPSEEDIQRAQFVALAREIYVRRNAADVPQREK